MIHKRWKLKCKILKYRGKAKARISPLLPFHHCFQKKFNFDQKHGTGEPDLGFGDIWHNIISKLKRVKSISCDNNSRKADILSISPHPCWSEKASKIEMPDFLSCLSSLISCLFSTKYFCYSLKQYKTFHRN